MKIFYQLEKAFYLKNGSISPNNVGTPSNKTILLINDSTLPSESILSNNDISTFKISRYTTNVANYNSNESLPTN